MKEKLKKINDFEWELPKGSRERMNVAARIIANKAIIDQVEDDAVAQLTNVACLPGAVEPVVGLPDMHWGLWDSLRLFHPQTVCQWELLEPLTAKRG